MASTLTPVILSGGIGSRLWPVSRRQNPKHLAPLFGDRSLMQRTALRMASLSGTGAPVIVCGESYHPQIAEQLDSVDVTARLAILEPVGRNTAAAVAAAALSVDGDELLLVTPADHLIEDGEAFARSVDVAVELATAGHLVTFGVRPSGPHTGYGYIQNGADLGSGAYAIGAFVEKPDAQTAESYLASGEYTWNSGMFLLRASAAIAELEHHAPAVLEAVSGSLAKGVADGTVVRLDSESFYECPSISFDHAVMEHTTSGAVVPLDAGWSDVGSWTAMWELADKDADGNAMSGAALASGVTDSYILAGERPVAVVGLDGVVVVDTGDAVLVLAKSAAEDVKDIVAQLEANRLTPPP